MKKTRILLILLIVCLLLLDGGILVHILKVQSKQIAAEEGAAAAAAGREIAGAAEKIAEAADRARKEMTSELAADHIFVHRDSSGARLEHSFPQYDAAIEQGARYIEQDIVISADGTLYVSHDLSAARMTGDSRAFSGMSDGQIDALRSFEGEKILRLSEVFDRYGTSIEYVIELKSADRRTIDAFSALVDQYGLQERIIAQCFDLDALQVLEEIYPDMRKLYLCMQQQDLRRGCEAACVDIVSAELQLLSEENVKLVHDSGKQCNVWARAESGSVLGEKQIRQAIDLGVDSYFTDDVELAFRAEKGYGFKKRYLKAQAAKSAKAQAGDTIFFASDYQEEPGWDAPEDNLTAILKAAEADGKAIDHLVFCGDYTNDRTLHDYQLSPEDAIGEIRQAADAACPDLDQEDMLFVQGNHDRLTESIAAGGLHEYDGYLLYVLNTEEDFPWKQGKEAGCLKKVTRASKEMKDCFDKLIRQGEKRPVLIAGHVPLHFTARTSSRHTTGDNLYGSLIFDVVNEAAKELNIVYFYGHNHSKGWDCYMGGSSVYKARGEKLLIPAFAKNDISTDRFNEETLRFTYLNAGYTGYFMNCGPEELENGTADRYHAADETLTGTVCEIQAGKLILTRYDADGVHPLGAAGEANPYKDFVDRGLIDEAYYAHETESPQEIIIDN